MGFVATYGVLMCIAYYTVSQKAAQGSRTKGGGGIHISYNNWKLVVNAVTSIFSSQGITAADEESLRTKEC